MTKTDKEIRKEIDDQFVRGLFLVNGGGIVALLAFVQAIWANSGAQAAIRCMVAGMFFMLVGLLLATITPILRRNVSLLYEQGDPKRLRRGNWSWGVQVGSVVFFAIGAAIVLVGIWRNGPPN